MNLCHAHNLNRALPARRPYGIRVSLRPGDPFARLVGDDWQKLHWFGTARERDEALVEMSRRYPFFRIGDEPALRFEKVERAGDGAT